MTVIVRETPYAVVTLAGNVLPKVFSIQITNAIGSVPTAQVVVPEDPASAPYFGDVEIVAGATQATAVTRFKGQFFTWASMPIYPRRRTLKFLGRAQKLVKYRLPRDENGDDAGLWLDDLVGASTATDEEIVRAVLTRAGVSFDPDLIEGTGTVFGSLADDAFVWPWDMPAWNYIKKIDEVSAVWTGDTDPAGFYTFREKINGDFVRTLIGGRPRGTAEAEYVEGVSLSRSANASRGVEDLFNAIRVTGYDFGGEAGKIEYFLQSQNDFQGLDDPAPASPINNAMIERETMDDPGDGMAAETVARAAILDVNKEAVTGSFSTPEDDPISGGSTITINALESMRTGEKVWVPNLTLSITAHAWAMSGSIIGGGWPDGDPNLPAVDL